MKVCARTRYGGPEVIQIEEVDKPVPKTDEILVKVYAATVNRTDCAILKGTPLIMRLFTGLSSPRNPILGTDFAGEIVAIGEDINSFKVGDKIFGFNDNGLGSHAEYLAISENQEFLTIPGNITYVEAAASLEGFHYAYNFINKTNLNNYHTVLVNGATGAIGSAILQLAKNYGAYVTAVCGTNSIDRVKSLGADRVIDYLSEDFTKGDQKYDFVFDTVGESSFKKCKPALTPGGIYIPSELGWMAQNVFLTMMRPFLGSKKVIFPVPTNIQGSIEFVRSLIHQGKFKPMIDRTYPLDEIVKAFRYVETGQKIGNVVITMNSNSES